MLTLLALFVVDGDTFHANSHKIRLWGIDAPEISTYEGVEAKEFLTLLVKDKPITCQQVDTDGYSREVSRCYVEGQDIACLLVGSGHAVDWPHFSYGYYKECQE